MDNETVWIIGASSGIGFELVQQLLDCGNRVVASSRNLGSLEELEKNSEGKLLLVPLDVTSTQSIDEALSRLQDSEGNIGTVVINAGGYTPVSDKQISSTSAREMMDINYFGPIAITEKVLPIMKEKGRGRLVYVASIAGYIGLPKALAYGPSKAALINFAEGLRISLQKTDIDIQLVNPGFVKTPLTANNNFKMPFLMEASEAASRIIEGMKSNHFEISFPKRFTYFMRVLQFLPYRFTLNFVSRRTVK